MLKLLALDTSAGNYPYAYYDFNTDSPQGVEVEFVKQFAAAYGYSIEWYDSDWDSCTVALTNHQVDLFVGGCSVYYAKAEEEAYGELPGPTGFRGRICHTFCPAAARKSTNLYASGPKSPIPNGDGREVGCSSTPH